MFSNSFGKQKTSNREFQRNEKDFTLNVVNSWEVWATGRNESCSQTEYIDLHQLEKLELLLVQSCRKRLQVMLFSLLDAFSLLYLPFLSFWAFFFFSVFSLLALNFSFFAGSQFSSISPSPCFSFYSPLLPVLLHLLSLIFLMCLFLSYHLLLPSIYN